MRKLNVSEVALVRHLVLDTEAPDRDAAIDWDVVIGCAGYHRLVPMLHQRVQRSDFPVPAEVRERLEKAFHVELARAVVRMHHVEQLEAHAERTGRALALLKGAAFAGALYPNPASRPMADIDVLARSSDMGRWESDMDGLGFHRCDVSDHATSFRHVHTGVYLEIHRSLTSCNGYLGVDIPGLFERAIPLGSLLTLCPEDHLIHLCLHASFQHGFRQAAVNACDAHQLVSQPGFDRGRFLELSRAGRLAPWIYGGLRLSHGVFPSERLGELVDALRDAVRPRIVRKLDRFDAATLLAPDPKGIAAPPFRRLLWAGDISSTLSLLKEVLRPRGGADASLASPWAGRATQLVWNHCLKVISLALMKHAHAVSETDTRFTWRDS